MRDKLTQKQIDVAVKWWSDVVKSPKFDNGSVDLPSLFASMLATDMAANVAPIKPALFAEQLAAVLREPPDFFDGLHVDYYPNEALSIAVRGTNMEKCLPWKTSMRFDRGGVQVSYGYGAPWIDLPLPLAPAGCGEVEP